MKTINILILLTLSYSFAQAQNDSTAAPREWYEDVEAEIEPEEEHREVFDIFQVTEVASFKNGGDSAFKAFIAENLEYPRLAKEESITGKVAVQFVIDKEGKVKEVKILGGRKLGWGCEAEAIRVIKQTSGHWNPAKFRDHKVLMRHIAVVEFKP